MLPASLVESFYALFVQERSKLKALFTYFKTPKCARKIEDKHGKHSLTTQRFVKTEVLTASGIVFTLYLRNDSELLRKQVESARMKIHVSKHGLTFVNLIL